MSGIFSSGEKDGGGFSIEDGFDRKILYSELLHVWYQFSHGKKRNGQVLLFWYELEKNIGTLCDDLVVGKYTHGLYTHFVICDPKRRDIYVPEVRDRIVHQWLVNYLQAIMQKKFYVHSYAAQKGKGVHAMRQYLFGVMASMGGCRGVWLGKIDIAKYYQTIDHQILKSLLVRHVDNPSILGALFKVIDSFGNGKGIPLGNVTSQWFGNMYLHELDWYAKHMLGITYYARYNDDVIIVGRKKGEVEEWVRLMVEFVDINLLLSVPEHKKSIQPLPSQVDILGIVTDGYAARLRVKTRKRLQEKVDGAVVDMKSGYWDLVSSIGMC